MGICWLVSGILPIPNHPRDHRLLRSPHERLGGRVVDPTGLPSHLAPLRSPLDFYQRDGEGLIRGFVASSVPVPEEERLIDARGEGDLQHLPGLRVSQPPFLSFRDYILSYPGHNVNPFFKFT